MQADDVAGAVQVQLERLDEGEVFLTALSEQRKEKKTPVVIGLFRLCSRVGGLIFEGRTE